MSGWVRPKCRVCNKEGRGFLAYGEPQDPKTCACKPKDGEEKDVAKFVDWRGREVRVGDQIAYPFLSGRSAGLAVGVVERIYLKAKDYERLPWQERLKVLPVERNWDRGEADEPDPAKRKRSTLMFWDRCIRLDEVTPA